MCVCVYVYIYIYVHHQYTSIQQLVAVAHGSRLNIWAWNISQLRQVKAKKHSSAHWLRTWGIMGILSKTHQ